ncbi:MAG: hypothetical protein MUC47_02085 [Candidatus Kapabacteria bacterium]|nr:hypothetical protein [Candidatus Kapabacteria bacterium]
MYNLIRGSFRELKPGGYVAANEFGDMLYTVNGSTISSHNDTGGVLFSAQFDERFMIMRGGLVGMAAKNRIIGVNLQHKLFVVDMRSGDTTTLIVPRTTITPMKDFSFACDLARTTVYASLGDEVLYKYDLKTGNLLDSILMPSAGRPAVSDDGAHLAVFTQDSLWYYRSDSSRWQFVRSTPFLRSIRIKNDGTMMLTSGLMLETVHPDRVADAYCVVSEGRTTGVRLFLSGEDLVDASGLRMRLQSGNQHVNHGGWVSQFNNSQFLNVANTLGRFRKDVVSYVYDSKTWDLVDSAVLTGRNDDRIYGLSPDRKSRVVQEGSRTVVAYNDIVTHELCSSSIPCWNTQDVSFFFSSDSRRLTAILHSSVQVIDVERGEYVSNSSLPPLINASRLAGIEARWQCRPINRSGHLFYLANPTTLRGIDIVTNEIVAEREFGDTIVQYDFYTNGDAVVLLQNGLCYVDNEFNIQQEIHLREDLQLTYMTISDQSRKVVVYSDSDIFVLKEGVFTSVDRGITHKEEPEGRTLRSNEVLHCQEPVLGIADVLGSFATQWFSIRETAEGYDVSAGNAPSGVYVLTLKSGRTVKLMVE